MVPVRSSKHLAIVNRLVVVQSPGESMSSVVGDVRLPEVRPILELLGRVAAGVEIWCARASESAANPSIERRQPILRNVVVQPSASSKGQNRAGRSPSSVAEQIAATGKLNLAGARKDRRRLVTAVQIRLVRSAGEKRRSEG